MIDPYLQPNSSYLRLLSEYKKYNNLIVAVDFDDTLFDFHQKGRSYINVINLIRDLKSIGCTILIWSGNDDKFIEDYCLKLDIPFDYINRDADQVINTVYKNKSTPRKIYANVYIDDRSGLQQVYQELSLLVNQIKNKNEF